MKHFKEIEALETLDYDENEISSFVSDSDLIAAQRDSMSDDSIAFDMSMRAYHAR